MPETVMVPGAIKSGKLTLFEKNYFARAVSGWPDCDVTLTLKRLRPSKSLEQLGYLYGVVLPDFAEATGDTVASVKWDLKVQFLTAYREVVNEKTGECRMQQYVRSIGSLNTKEMAEFIDRIIAEAGTMSIEIRPADPRFRTRASGKRTEASRVT